MSPIFSNRSIPPEDRVSALPDSILSHILSFLPTKCAAATAVLSKRWNPVWRSVLTLDFDGESFKDYTTFRHAVYSVMLSRQITLPIQKLRLKCRKGYDIHDINRFINAAIERGIKTLDLDMVTEFLLNGRIRIVEFKLTSSIFSCKTLTVLKLKNLLVKKLPPVNLPLLKILHLDFTLFIFYEDLVKFLLGCPNLEYLYANRVIVCSPQPKLVPYSTTVRCLPNLVGAHISDSVNIPFFLLSRALSLHMKLEWRLMLKVLQHSPKLLHLTVEADKINYQDNWEDPKIVPECLSSQLRTCLFKNCGGRKCELQFVEYVMQNSKVLRTMTIHSACLLDLNSKLQMLRKLSVYPRGCKLIFD